MSETDATANFVHKDIIHSRHATPELVTAFDAVVTKVLERVNGVTFPVEARIFAERFAKNDVTVPVMAGDVKTTISYVSEAGGTINGATARWVLAEYPDGEKIFFVHIQRLFADMIEAYSGGSGVPFDDIKLMNDLFSMNFENFFGFDVETSSFDDLTARLLVNTH
jgi:hypothetical protein